MGALERAAERRLAVSVLILTSLTPFISICTQDLMSINWQIVSLPLQ